MRNTNIDLLGSNGTKMRVVGDTLLRCRTGQEEFDIPCQVDDVEGKSVGGTGWSRRKASGGTLEEDVSISTGVLCRFMRRDHHFCVVILKGRLRRSKYAGHDGEWRYRC